MYVTLGATFVALALAAVVLQGRHRRRAPAHVARPGPGRTARESLSDLGERPEAFWAALTDRQREVIAEVGSRILRRDYPGALRLLDGWAAGADSSFRAALLDQRGAVLHLVGDPEGARASYAEAARLEPDNPNHWWHVAELEALVGDRDAAIDAASRVLRLPVAPHVRREAEGLLGRLG